MNIGWFDSWCSNTTDPSVPLFPLNSQLVDIFTCSNSEESSDEVYGPISRSVYVRHLG